MAQSALTTMLLFVGSIFSIASAIMHLFPPKKINYLYGYRTPQSMKSQKHWDFAQKYSSILMFKIGILMIGISFLGYFIKISENIGFIASIIITITSTIILLLLTERKLKHIKD